MPVEREVANAVSKSMENAGWEQTNQLPDGEAPNPFRLEYEKGSERLNLIVHARRLTAQSGVGTDHNRPAGEYHAQMIFDGDKRGSGQRQHLRFADDAKTLLVGYFLPQDEYIFAAYNPAYHQDYAYSKSLQLRKQTLLTAESQGIAFQTRKNGETVVAFRAEFLPDYIFSQDNLHQLSLDLLTEEGIGQDLQVEYLWPEDVTVPLPSLEPRERRRVVIETTRATRDARFARAIRAAYASCSICDFQYGEILDGAHIIPVTDPRSTDTYDNGFALCPTCHRLYDKGYILVDGEGRISINQHHLKRLSKQNKTGSLERVRSQLRETLALPEGEEYRPSPEKLQEIYDKRSK